MAEGDAILEFDDLINVGGGFDELRKNIKILKADLLDMAKDLDKAFDKATPKDTAAIEKLTKDVKKLETAKKSLTKQELLLEKAKKQNLETNQELLIQLQKEKLARREQMQRAKQLAIIQTNEKQSVAALRAQLSLVTLDWKKLTVAEQVNGKEGKKLVATKKQLTRQLKALEEATGDHRRSVGNYEKGMKRLRKTLMRVFVGRTIIDGAIRMAGALGDIVEAGKDSNPAFKKLSDSFSILKQNLTLVAEKFLNFIAGPLTSLFNTLAFVASKIASVSKEGSILGWVFSKIGWVFNGIITSITKIPALLGGTIAAFKEFGAVIGRTFNEVSLRIQRTIAQVERLFAKLSGGDLDAANRKVAALDRQIQNNAINTSAIIDKFKEGYNAVLAEQEEFNKNQKVEATTGEKLAAQSEARKKAIEEQNKLLEKQKSLLIEIQTSEKERLEAIEELGKKLTDAEINNIEDRQTQLTALEDERFKVEQSQRANNFELLKAQIATQEAQIIDLFGEGSEELAAFREQANKDILALQGIHDNLEVEQLKTHQENLLNIRKEFALKTEELSTISVQQDELDKQAAILNEEVALVEEANTKKKKSNDELLESVRENAAKVGELITELFTKQADLAKESVDKQAENLSAARQRAAEGLETNLVFEEEQLAKRQAEAQRRQKEAEQAQKIAALFSLVTAYATSGDENALQNALTDISLLTLLATGFEKGGYTGDVGQKQIAGLYYTHGKEYIVNAKDTAAYGLTGKSGSEFGEAMSDHFQPQGATTQSLFSKQKQAFESGVSKSDSQVLNDSQMLQELQGIRKQLASQPNVSIEVEKLYKAVYSMIKTENKENMKIIRREILRGK